MGSKSLSNEVVAKMHDVESIEADAASTMPAGLVNGLTIEQLLDLLAYLERTP